jgi:hypothetical protein
MAHRQSFAQTNTQGLRGLHFGDVARSAARESNFPDFFTARAMAEAFGSEEDGLFYVDTAAGHL